MAATNSLVTGLFTVTSYSFSWLFLARKILFTISEGSIVKYLEPSISLAEKYAVPNYLKQTLELLKIRVEGVFGREKEKQLGLGSWF